MELAFEGPEADSDSAAEEIQGKVQDGRIRRCLPSLTEIVSSLKLGIPGMPQQCKHRTFDMKCFGRRDPKRLPPKNRIFIT